MPQKLLWALGIIVVFSYLMSRKTRKVVSAQWKGTVTGVQHQRANVTRDADRQDDDWVTILYRTDAGTDGKLKIRMRVMRQFFAGLQVGDPLVKKQGNYLPRREADATESAAGTEQASV